MLDWLLYWFARLLLFPLQKLPLLVVSRIGRCLGAVAYALDRRHRRVAIDNLTRCFGQEKSVAEIEALARENFRRLGENYASAVRTSCMSDEEMRGVLEYEVAGGVTGLRGAVLPSRVIAVGHFGNFEVYARTNLFVPGVRTATTYRALRPAGLNRLLLELRERSGCLFFERRSGADALRAALSQPGIWLGLLVDQHAGDHGLRVPFMGHECSTSTAHVVLARRYNCPLHAAFCFRVAPGRWRIEMGPPIPLEVNGAPRPTEDICREINGLFEVAVRRDPANWFWVHKRWKPAPKPRPAAVAA